MELKSSPLKQLKNYEYRAKERLVLNLINYEEDYKSDIQQWNTELNGLLYENRNIIHTIGWIVGLKENT